MKTRIKKCFKTIVISMLIIGMIPLEGIEIPGQISMVDAAVRIGLNKTNAVLIKGQTLQLKLNGIRGKVRWSSTNNRVAAVNSAGKVVARTKGTAVIKAKFRNRTYICKIQIETPRISKTSITLYTNGSYTLKMLNTKQIVRWGSSRTSVAAVTSKGKVTARKAGTTVITAIVGSKKYTCKVMVKQKKIPTKQESITNTTETKEKNELEIIPDK